MEDHDKEALWRACHSIFLDLIGRCITEVRIGPCGFYLDIPLGEDAANTEVVVFECFGRVNLREPDGSGRVLIDTGNYLDKEGCQSLDPQDPTLGCKVNPTLERCMLKLTSGRRLFFMGLETPAEGKDNIYICRWAGVPYHSNKLADVVLEYKGTTWRGDRRYWDE